MQGLRWRKKLLGGTFTADSCLSSVATDEKELDEANVHGYEIGLGVQVFGKTNLF